MRNSVLVWLVGLTPLLSGPHAPSVQSGFVLVVNEANPVVSLRLSEVSKMFLRKVTTWPNGQPVEPVDQVASSVARRHFSDAVHRMDVPSVKSYWQAIVFSGRGEPPLERASDADVVAFVRGHINGVGYVSPGVPLSGVKVLSIALSPR